jgi:hypothetical protein
VFAVYISLFILKGRTFTTVNRIETIAKLILIKLLKTGGKNNVRVIKSVVNTIENILGFIINNSIKISVLQ